MSQAKQHTALALHELLQGKGIEYWLFGGWAVDFHSGLATRTHDDLDIAAWLKDHARIAMLLAADGWRHAPEQHEDGYTGYERDGLRLELAFLESTEDGHIYTPTREGRAAWPDGMFEGDVVELLGVRARVVTLRALKADKAETRDDPVVAAKDRADLASLSRFT